MFDNEQHLHLEFLDFSFQKRLGCGMKIEGRKHSFLKRAARHVIGERIGGHLLLHLMQLLGVSLCIHYRLGYLVVKLATGFLKVHLCQLPVVA